LPHVGFPYADGHVTGFALVPPRGKNLRVETDFLKALRCVMKHDGEDGHYLKVYFDGLPDIRLHPVTEPILAAQNPASYTKAAKVFATITPIILDRHLIKQGEAQIDEMKALIQSACANIGLPKPELDDIVPDKHSAFEGATSARLSGKAPAWMNWRLPKSLAGRPMTHAVLRFREEVEGPIMLGAGRFFGLGLCRPLRKGKA
jgi:CRISPR-associated protein Csb2